MRVFYPIFFLLLLSCYSSRHLNTTNANAAADGWQLIFSDEFNGKGKFDSSKWMYSPRQRAAWSRYLTQSPDYAFLDGGNLHLRMDNKAVAGDTVHYHAGGVQTKGKFSFKYGKVEVRARFNQGRGAWPAIWMMPEKDTYGGWPRSGEIDIMEHVNKENVVHQTIHNTFVTNAAGGSTATQKALYDTAGFNTYGIIWAADKIDFYINNQLNYTYHKPANATFVEWPFDQPFYIIMNQSGGAGWPGPITDDDLPFYMQIDWVRVYQKL